MKEINLKKKRQYNILKYKILKILFYNMNS